MASTSEGLRIERRSAFLIVRFSEPQRVASWAIVGGGLGHADAVAWLEVRNADLPPSLDPRVLLAQRLSDLALGKVVGLLTSRQLDAYETATRTSHGDAAHCVTTVGLGNALRAGDPPCEVRPVGTINTLCQVSTRLSDEALLEALAVATEAKTMAVCEASVPSIASGDVSSGTGTDCVVLACPAHGEPLHYAGKHTRVGHLIGACVHAAVARGAERWKREQAGLR